MHLVGFHVTKGLFIVTLNGQGSFTKQCFAVCHNKVILIILILKGSCYATWFSTTYYRCH